MDLEKTKYLTNFSIFEDRISLEHKQFENEEILISMENMVAREFF